VPQTGRIKFGTESNGGFRNITISNCVFEGCQGLALESVDGALLEDVTVNNLSMRDIVSAPIFLRLGRRMRGPDNYPVGTLKRIIISNIVCLNSVARLGSTISGIPGHAIEDVKISNVQIFHQGGGTKEDAAFEPPEYEETYPEPTMFGAPPRGAPVTRRTLRSMPSYGFYIRHVKGIQFDNIEIRTEKDDQRPAYVLGDVHDADFFRVQAPHSADAPTFALHNVTDFSVSQCAGVADTKLKSVERKLV
jgi:polygalacturonase